MAESGKAAYRSGQDFDGCSPNSERRGKEWAIPTPTVQAKA